MPNYILEPLYTPQKFYVNSDGKLIIVENFADEQFNWEVKRVAECETSKGQLIYIY